METKKIYWLRDFGMNPKDTRDPQALLSGEGANWREHPAYLRLKRFARKSELSKQRETEEKYKNAVASGDFAAAKRYSRELNKKTFVAWTEL